MHDHDIQGEAMTEADWRRMADRLTASYTALRGAIRASVLTTVGGSAEPRPEVSP
jgi:hypothetical protein